MRDRLSLLAAATAASLTLVGCVSMLAASAASAADKGIVFDWDGEKTADSGKSHMRFNGGGKAGDIIVSFGDRRLYFFTGPGEADTYPVAIPREQSRWEGVTSVSQKRENPSWTPTPHMLAENPRLPRWVPGGHPMNPLGNRALYLGSSDYRIHGTDAPWTIGTPVSKGCVRMFNKDVADLYPRVKVGSKVIVTWQKFDGKTMTISENKGITELPASGPLPAGPAAGKSTLASFDPGEIGSARRSKYRKTTEDDDTETKAASDARPEATDNAEKSEKSEKTKSAAQDDLGVKRRKLRTSAIEPVDTAPDSKDAKDHKDGKDAAVAATEATVEPVAKPERRVRTALHQRSAVKSDAGVETGSLPVSSKKADEAASLGIAERALAAAERAAAAAERAAAAAERAVAASQSRQPVDSPAVSNEVTAH